MDTTATILSVDLEGHTALLETYDVSKVREAVDSYRNIVDKVVGSFEGEGAEWSGDGTWFYFRGPRHASRAAWAGASILSSIALLNQDENRNPLPEPLRVRVAAGTGRLPSEGEPGKMISPIIGEVEALQKNGTREGGFSIYDSLYQRLGERAQKPFGHRKGKFRGHTVYYYSRHEVQRPPSKEELARLVDETERRCNAVLEIFRKSSAQDLAGFLAVEAHWALQKAYERVSEFLQHYSEVRRIWSDDYTRQVGAAAERLLALQRELWATLEPWFSSKEAWQAMTPELDQIRTLLLGQHLDAGAGLSFVQGKVQELLAFRRAPGAYGRHQLVYEGLLALAEANDELERIESFIKVFHYDRRELVQFLSKDMPEDLRRRIQTALWPHAELVVAEDLACAKRGFCLPGGVVGILADDSPRGLWFGALQRALVAQQLPSTEWWHRLAGPGDGRLVAENLRGLLRCLVLGHQNPSLQYLASRELEIEDFWPLVAYQRVPIRALTLATRKLEAWPDPNARKIFFDAVRSRLHQEIDRLRPGTGGQELGALLATLLGFDEWVEDRYFRDAELLVSHVEARMGLFGESLPRALEDKLRALSNKRTRAGSPRARLPVGVEHLNPPLKLHLARQGFYLPPFACDDDDRIALATADFLCPSMARHVVAYAMARGRTGLNGALLTKLQEKGEVGILAVLQQGGTRPGTGLPVDLRSLSPHEQGEVERLVRLYQPRS